MENSGKNLKRTRAATRTDIAHCSKKLQTIQKTRNQNGLIDLETKPVGANENLENSNKYEIRFSSPNKKYESIAKIGEGTYGEVFKARVKNTVDEIVALKRIKIINNSNDLPNSISREVSILEKINHENVVNLIEVCYSKSQAVDFIPTFYLVFDFCAHDLLGLLRRGGTFTLGEIKNMMKQLLDAVSFMHSKKILHRDLKCANILITKEGILKLADFGLARCFDDSKPSKRNKFTNKVVTLWYRAPELLLGSTNYGPAIDMWAVGCIMAEMFKKKPLFCGTGELNQLTAITQLCGSIRPKVWPKVRSLKLYRSIKLPRYMKRCLIEKLTSCVRNEDALSLIDTLLHLDPNGRLSANDALKHNFFLNDPIPCSLEKKLSKLKGNMYAKLFN